MIEAMACGTPIVAYARGSVPEVVVDGETGFIVNTTNEDIRGDFIIKKTGIEGLCEAVNRIYAMPRDEYMLMRRKCRMRVEEHFTSDKMASNYIDLYKKVLSQS
jgi:glycosyltransferase involved in cell wall biosynthesis